MVSWVSMQTCVFWACVCICGVHMYICFTLCNACARAYVGCPKFIKVEVCRLLEVLRRSVFSLWTHLCYFGGFTHFLWQLFWHTHTQARTQSRLHKQTLVLKDGKEHKPGQKDSNSWHSLQRLDAYIHTPDMRNFPFHRSRSHMYTTTQTHYNCPQRRSND